MDDLQFIIYKGKPTPIKEVEKKEAITEKAKKTKQRKEALRKQWVKQPTFTKWYNYNQHKGFITIPDYLNYVVCTDGKPLTTTEKFVYWIIISKNQYRKQDKGKNYWYGHGATLGDYKKYGLNESTKNKAIDKLEKNNLIYKTWNPWKTRRYRITYKEELNRIHEQAKRQQEKERKDQK